MKARISPWALIMVAGMVNSACQLKPNDPPLRDRLQTINTDLKTGDAGENVRAVHEYLAQFGYYPNADLAARYPAWRPFVSNAPEDPSVFDQQTESAIRQLQLNYGLSPTGVVDAPTRAAMTAARCGVPDGIPRLDPSDKFSIGTLSLLNNTLAGYIGTSTAWPAGVTQDTFVAAGQDAESTWDVDTPFQMSLTLTSGGVGGTSGTSTFVGMGFGGVDGAGNQLAFTRKFPDGSQEMEFDYQDVWSADYFNTPSNAYDMESVILHELGHSIGLGHSSFSQAVMYPTFNPGTQKRSLAVDDQVAAISRGGVPYFLPAPFGAIHDIGTGADGTIWALGAPQVGNEYSIYTSSRFSSWTVDSIPAHGLRISVAADGTPWSTDSIGNIYHRTSKDPSTGTWDYVPGVLALDIAASAAGVWAVGKPGNAGVWQYVNGQWVNDPSAPANPVRISVDDNGTRWIVQSGGKVYRSGPGGWNAPPGNSDAVDIAAPPGTPANTWYAWVLRSSANQLTLQLWNQQLPVSGPPGLTSPGVFQWDTVSTFSPAGALAAVSADWRGGVYVVAGDGTGYRPRF